MDALPTEILREIVGHFSSTNPSDRDVLKNLRLITRPIQAVATPHLFHTLQVWTNLGSLQRLDMVSKTESLTVCIRKLDFFPHLYSPSFDITSGMLLIHSATGDIWEDWKSAFAPFEAAALSSLAAKLSTEWYKNSDWADVWGRMRYGFREINDVRIRELFKTQSHILFHRLDHTVMREALARLPSLR